MKFATILREAGFPISEFKSIADIPLNLYDEKHRITSNEDVHFSEKIFAKNLDSYSKFYSFLRELEENPVDSVSIMVTEYYLIVLRKAKETLFFPRTVPLYPLAYMD